MGKQNVFELGVAIGSPSVASVLQFAVEVSEIQSKLRPRLGEIVREGRNVNDAGVSALTIEVGKERLRQDEGSQMVGLKGSFETAWF